MRNAQHETPADPQTTSSVLMIRPRNFAANPETAESNRFQRAASAPPAQVHAAALTEFDALAAALRQAGTCPLIVEDTSPPVKPDAVFPNNWVSFHGDGTVILYPMQAPNRRPERRSDVIEHLSGGGRFRVTRIIDLSPLEERGLYLEGTGSLVIDHPNRVAYAGLSSRTHAQAIAEFTRQTGLEVVTFQTGDERGRPLYHTNVMLSIGQRFAVVCAEAIPAARERGELLERLTRTGRDIAQISLAQMRSFAANILELDTGKPRSVIAMSEVARRAFHPEQIEVLTESADILAAPIGTIERVGGGSVRCMLAEIFLPQSG